MTYFYRKGRKERKENIGVQRLNARPRFLLEGKSDPKAPKIEGDLTMMLDCKENYEILAQQVKQHVVIHIKLTQFIPLL